MTKISQLPSIGDSLAIGDQFLIRDIDDAGNPNKSVTVSGITRALDLGTAAAPAVAFASDKNTGIFSPSADTLAISTGGTGRLTIGSDGTVVVNTSPLTLNGTGGGEGGQLNINNSTNTVLVYSLDASTDTNARLFTVANNTNLQIGQLGGTGGTIQFFTAAAERARIDSSGRLLVGTSSARVIEPYGFNIAGQIAHTFESVGDATPGPGLALCSNSTTGEFGPYLYLCRSRGSSVGSNTVVANGDNLGTISFAGADGTDLRTRGGVIHCEVDGTPGTNDMPGRLIFSTTADGASTPTERLRITSTGNVGIGTTSPTSKLDVLASVDGVATVARFSNVSNLSAATQSAIDLQADSSVSRISNLRDGTGTFGTTIISNTAAGVMGERVRIDSSGRLLVGTSTAYGSATSIETHSSTQFGPQILLRSLRNDAFGPYIVGHKIRSSSIVQSGDTLITLVGEGFDGATYATAARIELQVDGTPGANDMPGRIVFATTADGAASPTERLRITSAGNVGIGTTSPAVALEVRSASNQFQVNSGAANSSYGLDAGAGYCVFKDFSDASEAIQLNNAGFINFTTASAERARIDTSGRLLVGTSTGISEQFSGQARTQIAGTNYYNLASFQYSNDAFENVTSFCKSRGATIGTHAVVQSNDTLSSIRVQGSDGTGFLIAAAITGQADGSAVTTAGSFVVGRRYKILTVGDTNFTLIGASANTVGVIFAATGVGTGTGTATSEPYTNSMPGRLVFSTTADGAASPTERLRITSAGVLQINDAGNITVGTTTGTKIGTATTQKLGFYNATPVVQPAAVANATTSVDVITQLNDLLAKLRTLGIIAT